MLYALLGLVAFTAGISVALLLWMRFSRRIHQILNNSPVAVYATDIEGKIYFANQSFSKLTGYSLKELKGKTPSILKSGKTAPEYYQRLWETIKAGEVWNEEITNKKKDGSYYSTLQYISPHFSKKGRLLGFIAVQEDAEERNRIASTLTEYKHAAEEAARTKRSFLSIMNHEMRTPLNSILGFARLIQEADPLPEIKRYADSIEQSGQNLTRMVSEMLDISRIESDLLELTPEFFNPLSALIEINGRFKDRISRKNLELILKHPAFMPRVKLDPSRWRQISYNLMDNAVKFTDSGKIEVKLDWTPERSRYGCLSLSITDTGIGIDARFHEVIFDRFSQLENQDSRRFSGTGLGLAIVKSLVSIMGGDLNLTSEAGQGSCFTVRFPGLEASSNYESNESTAKSESEADRLQSDSKAPVLELPEQWLLYFMETGPAVKARSVPEEIAAWAREQIDTYKPGALAEGLLQQLSEAADNWDIAEMTAKWQQIEQLTAHTDRQEEITRKDA
ncbi:PAS domain-containing sensor histidine kinase [Spirochaeta dissipatitropha]